MWSLEKLITQKQNVIYRLKEKYANFIFTKDKKYKNKFSNALRKHYPCAIIAEVKMASPSKGILLKQDPILLSKSYIEAGAAALSVVTEPNYFKGNIELLRRISDISSIPVFRKDFIVDPIELIESKANGADAVLLIASLLSQQQLRELLNFACELDLETVVEIHDYYELHMALSAGAKIIGINNRNLKDLSLSIHTTEHIAPKVPDDVLLISESGISSQREILRLNEYGVYAFLVGTSLIQSPAPKEKLQNLKSPIKRMLEQDGPFIKFCGITNPKDAIDAISSGADLLGYVFCESKRRISFEEFQRIQREVAKEVPKVAVVTLKELVQWRSLATEGISAFQVHGCEPGKLFGIQRPFCIPSMSCTKGFKERSVEGFKGLPLIHLDGSPMGGSGKVCHFELAKVFRALFYPSKVILAGGLTPSNVFEALSKVKPWAVDVSTGIEYRFGKKDKIRMQGFREAVKRWEKEHETSR
jgi:indole-3-glycerol phosphate synthase/phosphoribosylanthranilate isomerase